MITLTDEEIVCTLKCCGVYHSCDSCPFYEDKVDGKDCLSYLQTYALDLINRQKSEIEKMNIQLQELWNTASLYKAEGERWKDYNENLLTANTVLSNEILEAKEEAYKEFAEKLNEQFLNLQYNAKTTRKTVKIEELKEQMDWILHTVAIETIDNILKEMLGEKIL